MAETELIRVDTVDDALIDNIIERITQVVSPVRIIMFGSQAQGKANRFSDLDILVVIEEPDIPKRKIASKIYGVLAGILIPKDIIVTTPEIIEDWKNVPEAFISTAVNSGKVIYERQV